MVRLRGEGKIEHRAFLLWAVGGASRTLQSASRAIRKPGSSLRDWRKKFEWERRYRETADPDIEAYLVYQREYLAQCGSAAIMRVAADLAPMVGFLSQVDADALRRDEAAARDRARGGVVERESYRDAEAGLLGLNGEDADADPVEDTDPSLPAPAPFVAAAPRLSYRRNHEDQITVDPTGARVPPRVRQPLPDPALTERVVSALGLGSAAIVPQVVQPGAGGTPRVSREEQIALSIERDLRLIDASLGYFAKKLAAGEIPVRMSDLPTLLKVKQLLLGRSTSNVAVAVASTTAAPVPTVRVQQALTEDARYDAYREDVADLATILDGIAAGRERDAGRDAIVTTTDKERQKA